ncbi:MAG: hypothetical protein WA418_28495, partial [Bradyrhizobium sp.]
GQKSSAAIDLETARIHQGLPKGRSSKAGRWCNSRRAYADHDAKSFPIARPNGRSRNARAIADGKWIARIRTFSRMFGLSQCRVQDIAAAAGPADLHRADGLSASSTGDFA